MKHPKKKDTFSGFFPTIKKERKSDKSDTIKKETGEEQVEKFSKKFGFIQNSSKQSIIGNDKKMKSPNFTTRKKEKIFDILDT